MVTAELYWNYVKPDRSTYRVFVSYHVSKCGGLLIIRIGRNLQGLLETAGVLV
jgi:hypothetical protein